FFFQAEDGIRDGHVTGVQTCALPICSCRDGAFRDPTHEGDWRADRTRRGVARYPPLDLPRRNAARGSWADRRPYGVIGRESNSEIGRGRVGKGCSWRLAAVHSEVNEY